jgi:hypothetical protein
MRIRNTTRNTWILGSIVTMALFGCSGRLIDLGGTSSGTNDALASQGSNGKDGGTDDGSSLTSTSSYGTIPGASLCTVPPPKDEDAGLSLPSATTLAPLLGTWTGYAETLTPPDGVLTLTFAKESDGTVTGSLTFGHDPPPPPATSKTAPYPPDLDTAGHADVNGGIPDWTQVPDPYPGFPYTVRHVSFDGTRLQLDFLLLEVWTGWCELQTSYAYEDQEISNDPCQCLPSWSSVLRQPPELCFLQNDVSPNDMGALEPISCSIFAVCHSTSPCFCRSTGCTVDPNGTFGTLDVKLESNQLIGSVTSIGPTQGNIASYFDLSSGPWNVTLTRSK